MDGADGVGRAGQDGPVEISTSSHTGYWTRSKAFAGLVKQLCRLMPEESGCIPTVGGNIKAQMPMGKEVAVEGLTARKEMTPDSRVENEGCSA